MPEGKHMTKRLRIASNVVMAALAAGAGQVASAETLRVSAAASLTEAFQEIARAFESAHPGDSVELNFAGSQVLRTQIEQGAPVDVFASADLVHAGALRASGLLGRWQVFARNRIVVVVPARESKVDRLQDLARPGVKVVVAGATVPVGRYTGRVLANLTAARLFGDDFQARVEANVASQETNVRAVVSKVVLGEADAGFVYATDAASASDKVRAIEIPARCNVVAEYPIGVVAKSAAAGKAKEFVALVLGGRGQEILRRHGFAP
jgi:molybdate transport system substrate-binding protein